jgi:hypothetical protein
MEPNLGKYVSITALPPPLSPYPFFMFPFFTFLYFIY